MRRREHCDHDSGLPSGLNFVFGMKMVSHALLRVGVKCAAYQVDANFK